MQKRIRPTNGFRDETSWLIRLTRRLAGPSAEDLAQETWARKLARDGTVEERNPRAYLATIARNLVTDHARRSHARGGAAVALDDLPEHLAPSFAPDQDSAILLKQVILALPPIYRDTFILNRFIGLTYAEIAQRQGITVKAVEYRMSRALALCQEALRD
jgi:RNA polymerase sigma factor (sigma-70 family)